MAKLAEYNKLFFKRYKKGSTDIGLYYLSEIRLGKHTFETRLALELLYHSARDGNKEKNREYERTFLKEHGKHICEFLRLDYDEVVTKIELLWHQDQSKRLLQKLVDEAQELDLGY